MLGVSKLMFAAQLRTPTKKFLRSGAASCLHAIRGPGKWTPMNFLPYLKKSCFFPVAIQDFETLCRATMLRTGIKTMSDWREDCQSILDNAFSDNNYNFIHPLSAWVRNIAVHSLQKACEGFSFTDFMVHMDKDSSWQLCEHKYLQGVISTIFFWRSLLLSL